MEKNDWQSTWKQTKPYLHFAGFGALACLLKPGIQPENIIYLLIGLLALVIVVVMIISSSKMTNNLCKIILALKPSEKRLNTQVKSKRSG